MDKNMDNIELNNTIRALSRSIEDVIYRVYTLEDNIATVNAYIEDNKGEKNGKSRRLQLERED
jgi:predicted  nucleic acid-binding Zn-ribbon protein